MSSVLNISAYKRLWVSALVSNIGRISIYNVKICIIGADAFIGLKPYGLYN